MHSRVVVKMLMRRRNPRAAFLLSVWMLSVTQVYEASIRIYSVMMEQLSSVTGDLIATLSQVMTALLAFSDGADECPIGHRNLE